MFCSIIKKMLRSNIIKIAFIANNADKTKIFCEKHIMDYSIIFKFRKYKKFNCRYRKERGKNIRPIKI